MEVVGVLLGKLVPLISREANLLIGIRGEVESIKDELESIASFLVEADAREARGDSDPGLKTWVSQVRDVAYDIEDVMDEYMHHVARRRQEPRAYKVLRATDRSVRKLVTRHEIAWKIADINTKVEKIKTRTNRYGLTGSSSTQQQQQTTTCSQIASLFCGEDELVGVDGPRNELWSWLQEDRGGKRTVLSVVGMGGLGKTTLTRKVYDGRIGSFDCHAWITVSQTFVQQELLKSLLRQFYESKKKDAPARMETMDEIELVTELRAYVEQKRYVVVFDDVWTRGLCEDMLHALPENDKSSRIIFTTRNEDVAPSYAQSSLRRVYKMPYLSFEDSFKLFCKRVFHTCNELEELSGLRELEDLSEEERFELFESFIQTCNQELEDLSEEEGFELFCKKFNKKREELLCPPELRELSEGIVKKCDGLPLAIVTVGGVLSSKEKNISEWKKFHDSLGSKLQSDQQLTRVLSLSYHDLSPNLKSCLLYLSIYPEDCSIRCARLIRQWIAEGFVKAKNNQEPEDVAEEYLSELIRRCVIQVSKVYASNRVRECRVHDLIREFLLSKSKDMRFWGVFGETVDGKCRRLSMAMARDDLNMNVKVSLVRSLFVFQNSEFSKDFTRVLFGNLRLVTVLDLEGSGVKFLPESVGDLFQLKYLSVRNTVVEELPKSIGRLEQLETLDLKGSRVRKLPIEIKRLRKLRHLLAYSNIKDADTHSRQGVKIQEGLGCWETLQKLYTVEANSGTIIKDLIKFTKLRRLGIYKVRSKDVIELCNAIGKMRELRSLEIVAIDAQQVLHLESIHSPPPFLQALWLHGRLEALPSWIAKLQNLVRLVLRWSGLTDDHFGVLQTLPNLLYLGMGDDAYNGDQLHFKRGGFPKLKTLSLFRLKVLKHLLIEQGALPCLEEMMTGPVSPQMMEVPSTIQHLTNLKLIIFVDFSEELCMKMVPEGPSWSIIQHIPTVRFLFSNYDTGGYDFFTPTEYQNRKVNK